MIQIYHHWSKLKTKLLLFAVSLLAVLLPLIASAGDANFDEASAYLTDFTGFINGTVIPLIFVIAIVVFIWGMYLYFIQGGAKDDEREKGKQLLLWSLIGFVLMLSVVGIVNLLARSTGFTGDTLETLPTVPELKSSGGSSADRHSNRGA